MKHTSSSSSGHNRQSRPRTNAPSILLTNEENELLFSLLGQRCQALSTAVVQLYSTDAPAHSYWVKKSGAGAVCFVKDNNQKSYFIRFYCLTKNKLIWEEELYEAFAINKSRDYLLDFQGKNCLIALNFASEDEAENFFKVVSQTVTNRNRKRQERRNRRIPPPAPQNDEQDGNIILRNQSTTSASMPIVPTPANIAPIMSAQHTYQKDNKKTYKKITKEQIGSPSNFKHVSHIGWSAQKGLDVTTGDEIVDKILTKAGVSERDLKDRDTRDFIYEFINKTKVLDNGKIQLNDQMNNHGQHPPPVPSRQQNQNGGTRVAPPPPIRQPPPPVPKTTNVNRGPPPSRPPPIVANSSQTSVSVSNVGPAPPPPPPPPPPQSTMKEFEAEVSVSTAPKLPAPTDSRNALLDSIRKGTTLKKVEPSTTSSTTTEAPKSRDNLLTEIRQGIELKPAAQRELGPKSNESGTDGIDAFAHALRRALEDRKNVFHSSDDDSNSENDEEDWD